MLEANRCLKSEAGLLRDTDSPTKAAMLSSETAFRSMGIFGSVESMPLCDTYEEEHRVSLDGCDHYEEKHFLDERGGVIETKFEEMEADEESLVNASVQSHNVHLMGVRMGVSAPWTPHNSQEDHSQLLPTQRWPHTGNQRSNSVADPGLSAEAGQMVSLLGSLPLTSCNNTPSHQHVVQQPVTPNLHHQQNSPSNLLNGHSNDPLIMAQSRARGSRGRSTRGRPPWKRRTDLPRRDSTETAHYGSYIPVHASQGNSCDQKMLSITPVTTASTQESTVEIMDEFQCEGKGPHIGNWETDDCHPLSTPSAEASLYNTPSEGGKGVGHRSRRNGPPRPRGRPRKYPPTLPRDYRPQVFCEERNDVNPYGAFERDLDSVRRKEKRGRPSSRGIVKGGRLRRLYRGQLDGSDCNSGLNMDAQSDTEIMAPEQDNTFVPPNIDNLKTGVSDGLFAKLCVGGERNIRRVLQYNHPELAQSMGKVHWEMLEKEPWLAYQLVADVKPMGQRYHFNMAKDILGR